MRTFTRRELLAGASTLALAACASRARTGAAGAPQGGLRYSMNLLLLGGTGFLGPAVVRAALERGHRPTLFHRGKTRPGLFPGVEEVFGDRDGGLAPLRGRAFDAVVDTSGYVPRVVRQSVEALSGGTTRYLFVSTISAYAEPVPIGADESAPLARLEDPASEDVKRDYGALKAACERVVQGAFGDRAIVVRPGLIVGPEDPTDRFTYWPARLARGGEVLAPGDGEDPAQVVDVRDVGAFLVHLLEEGAKGTFDVTGPARPTRMRELLAEVQRGVGGDARLTWVGTKFLEEQGVQPWQDLPVWAPRPEGAVTVSNARALATGLALRPVSDTSRDTLAWWRTLPEERRAKPKAGLDPAREARVLAAWHARK